nr:MAG TPA: hypothetical protein [Caudoviricetes sp.]
MVVCRCPMYSYLILMISMLALRRVERKSKRY